MRTLLTLLVALAFTVGLRADPMDDVKRLLDEPVELRFSYPPTSQPKQIDERVSQATGVKEVRFGKVKLSASEFFRLMSTTQGRTPAQTNTLADLAVRNGPLLKSKLMPALKAAKLTSAAADLDEAFKLVEASKSLDRAAQDRFARLAKVAQ